MATSKEQITTLLECPVCLETYNEQDGRTPATLKCGHTLCLEHCHGQVITPRRCPLCRRDFNKTPSRNVLLCEMIAELSKDDESSAFADGLSLSSHSSSNNKNDRQTTPDTMLKRKLRKARALLKSRDNAQAADSKLIDALSKKLESLLLDNETLRDERDALRHRLRAQQEEEGEGEGEEEEEGPQQEQHQQQPQHAQTKSSTLSHHWRVEPAVLAGLVLFLGWSLNQSRVSR